MIHNLALSMLFVIVCHIMVKTINTGMRIVPHGKDEIKPEHKVQMLAIDFFSLAFAHWLALNNGLYQVIYNAYPEAIKNDYCELLFFLGLDFSLSLVVSRSVIMLCKNRDQLILAESQYLKTLFKAIPIAVLIASILVEKGALHILHVMFVSIVMTALMLAIHFIMEKSTLIEKHVQFLLRLLGQ